ncbi:MAG: PIN domain-containing protein [Xanthomonadaceae bacterium]|nr:PIN domain-containing protein [Xanthomonadaceae bacterium]MDE2257444.1 PIN domain-containing protein [Xanthomonadaceae bacterium]
MRVFIDTNLWAYRLDKREADKSRRIGAWLRTLAREHEIVVSTQVLIELRAVLTRKFKPPMSARDTSAALDALAHFEVVVADANLVLDAHELAGREQLEWFDALIVEAAIRSGCERLYSEDLSHGRSVAGLTVLNPFLPAPD